MANETEGLICYWLDEDFGPETMEADAAAKEEDWVQPLRADGTLPNNRLGPAIGSFVMSREIQTLETTLGFIAEVFAITPIRAAEALVMGNAHICVERCENIAAGKVEWDGV